MMKTELLAPAGTYESFLGAIHAGADAVYLAGQKFGARAYAGNFSTEELCRAIRYAHLSDRKVYLTLNTLVKESEFGEIYDYLHPFYEEGLDGIIIQDLGVLTYIRETFPKLPLHISTQATVTGVEGAGFLKEQGAVRVVPARELSLREIQVIKQETGLELETFIHGAMCYCYSGQCLFSSIAGGRSGNRGRCAQPCRLPYQLKMDGNNCFQKESYPLSLKDMCTIEDIPRLLAAGIDSFKIEGRMKKPEYAAGVTAIYRKYIDRWYESPEKSHRIEPKDLQKLSSLYIRSEVENGYYFRHNDARMITLDSPAYSGSDEKLLETIRRTYLVPEKKLEISIYMYCRVGEPLMLTLYALNEDNCCISLEGPIVEEASKQPATPESIREKISKMGNTFFEVAELQIDLGENCFIPVKILNELRREASLRLEDAILKQKSDMIKDSGENPASDDRDIFEMQATDIARLGQEARTVRLGQGNNLMDGFCVLVSDKEQLEACGAFVSQIDRLYIESDLLLSKEQESINKLTSHFEKENPKLELYVALPFIIRLRDQVYLERLRKLIEDGRFAGCLIRNVEELGIFTSKDFKGLKLALDAGMYSFQKKTVDFYKGYADTITFPYELNRGEKKNLMRNESDVNFEQVVFGRIPMMITANCLAKTAGNCVMQRDGKTIEESPLLTLIDRYKHEFPVQNICTHCYNIIWNCLPLSLHSRLYDYEHCLKRIQFTTESANEVKSILGFFLQNENSQGEFLQNQKEFPIKDYTTGHEKRGVE